MKLNIGAIGGFEGLIAKAAYGMSITWQKLQIEGERW